VEADLYQVEEGKEEMQDMLEFLQVQDLLEIEVKL
jgi:hypothetical protein